MPFTTVPDKTTGAVFTETNWDTDIAANLNTGLWTPIARALGLGFTQVDFDGVPSGYAAILMTCWARHSSASTGVNVWLRLNDDVGANYDRNYMGADGNVADAGESLAATQGSWAVVPGASSPADHYGGGFMVMPAYDQSDRHKSWYAMTTWKRSLASGGMTCRYDAGFWRSTAAVTKVSAFFSSGTFAGESVVNLYGLALT
jgi:hypothetical protein